MIAKAPRIPAILLLGSCALFLAPTAFGQAETPSDDAVPEGHSVGSQDVELMTAWSPTDVLRLSFSTIAMEHQPVTGKGESDVVEGAIRFLRKYFAIPVVDVDLNETGPALRPKRCFLKLGVEGMLSV